MLTLKVLKETIALDLGNGLEQLGIVRHLGSGGFFDSYHVRLQEGRPDWPEELVLRKLSRRVENNGEFVKFLYQVDSAIRIVNETREALGDLLARPCLNALETGRFMLNEFVPGQTLAEHFHQQWPGGDNVETVVVNIKAKLSTVIDVIERLEGNKLMHGDLSVNNIIVTPEESLRVIDWDGIVRRDAPLSSYAVSMTNYWSLSNDRSKALLVDRSAVPEICKWLIGLCEEGDLERLAEYNYSFYQALMQIVGYYWRNELFELNELRAIIGNP